MTGDRQLALALTAEEDAHATDLRTALPGDIPETWARREEEVSRHVLTVTATRTGLVEMTCRECFSVTQRQRSVRVRELAEREVKHQGDIKIGLRRRDLLARINDGTVVL